MRKVDQQVPFDQAKLEQLHMLRALSRDARSLLGSAVTVPDQVPVPPPV
jgi:hypothetical protein